MSTSVEAFRPSFISESFTDVWATVARGQVVAASDVARYCQYATQARELGFTGTERLWSQIVSLAQTGAGTVEIHESTDVVWRDWQARGLSAEDAWQAMWLV